MSQEWPAPGSSFPPFRAALAAKREQPSRGFPREQGHRDREREELPRGLADSHPGRAGQARSPGERLS